MLPAVCARLLPVCATVVIALVAIAGPVRAWSADQAGSLSELPIRGGLRAALEVIGDRAVPDRGQFLLEFTRRFYDTPIVPNTDTREPLVRALAARLAGVGSPAEAAPAVAETLPLPLSSDIWTKVVFGGRVSTEGLASAIVESRNAALLYYGLMSLDGPTRGWLAERPDVLGVLASKHAAAFTAAAPGLRISGGVVRVPGGEDAAPAWEALIGRRVTEPAEFVASVLAHGDGRLAFFFGAMGHLTPSRLRIALRLDSTGLDARADAARRLYAVFGRVAPGWRIEERTFWRPALDPARVLAELPVDDRGALVLPGTRGFWTAVFDDADQARRKAMGDEEARALAIGDPVDFLWLCEQVFSGEYLEQRRRSQLVMFGSRILRPGMTPDTVRDAIETVRSSGAYPALAAVLERANVRDVAAYAAAARAAARLSRIDDASRAQRATAQFQGGLGLFARAAVRGSVTPDRLTGLVESLSAVALSDQGEYEGRLVRWLATQVPTAPPSDSETGELSEVLAVAPGALERGVLRLLAGAELPVPRHVDWEGTRYRLDPAWAEARRLTRLLGEQPVPYLSSAGTLVGISDAIAAGGLTRDALRRHLTVLEQLAQTLGWDGAGNRDDAEGVHQYRDVAAALRRAADDGDVRAAARVAAGLRGLADRLLARGLLEFAYAAAMGQPDRAIISAAEAAGRHDFGMEAGVRRSGAPWLLPRAGATMQGWRVTGSLLGLDVRLAEFSLQRVSSRPPPTRPELNDEDRRVLIQAVALVQPLALADAEHAAIVAALRNGRARVAAMRTAGDAAAIAEEIRLGPARRSVLPWVLAHDRERLNAFLSPVELLWLGLEQKPAGDRLHAWGAAAEPRLGCLCLQMLDRRPWEEFAGRWNAGILASGFSDLNLRLAELLADLRMPGALLAPVLAAATLELVNRATSRDQDDRRGLVEFVHALRAERMEQYLALLTTDGPLVPVGAAPGSAVSAGPADVHTRVPQ